MLPINPQVPWQPKADRKIHWYTPPKNLASHSFQKNNLICDNLLEMSEYYKKKHDTRQFVYMKAVFAIKAFDKQIKGPDDLKQVKGLNNAMITKAKEILNAGSLKKMKNFYCGEFKACKQL